MRQRGFKIAFEGYGLRGTVCEFVITRMSHPSFDRWKSWSRPGAVQKQREWFEAKGGEYPVLWIQISRVWPAVSWFFNVWQKGKIESEPPAAGGWTELLDDIERCLRPVGVIRLSEAEFLELVPFVVERVSPSDDDDSAEIDDDDEVNWILDPADVAQCLFQPL